MKITAVVLTFNEELHLGRCLRSLDNLVGQVLVVDCFSTDKTLEIAGEYGARVLQRAWTSHSEQFNWALTQLDADTEWVFRIDADEVLSPSLCEEFEAALRTAGAHIDGIYCGRRMTFSGRIIKHGGVFPVRVLRLFRFGRGQCENRWMDEHIKILGETIDCAGEILDDNLNTLSWWIDKHNRYASREAVDLLNLEYGFMSRDSVASLRGAQQTGVKRWIKEHVYARAPLGFRAVCYFLYRYIFKLGFLDGQAGAAFHLLQGFWYRYLVDAKLAETKRYMAANGVDVRSAIRAVLDVKV